MKGNDKVVGACADPELRTEEGLSRSRKKRDLAEKTGGNVVNLLIVSPLNRGQNSEGGDLGYHTFTQTLQGSTEGG